MMTNRPILRLFLINWAIGIAMGCGFAAGLLWADIGHLRSLILASDMVVPALLLLFGGFSITCGGVVCGSAIMRMAREDDGQGGGLATAADPVPVRIARQSRS